MLHIGQTIKKIAQSRKLRVKDLQAVINRERKAVYRTIYNVDSIESDVLINLSQLLHTNLFSLFRQHPVIRNLPDPDIDELREIVKQQQRELEEKDALLMEKIRRIEELEEMKKFYQEKLADKQTRSKGKKKQ